jgi:flagellar basal-body rod modification protein FlgD
MSPSVPATAGSSALSGAGATSGSASAASTDVTKTEFLQLLVAQIKNQDPLNPTDGTQFVTQLAQLQQLEQSVNTGQDVSAIRQDLDNTTASGNDGATATQS